MSPPRGFGHDIYSFFILLHLQKQTSAFKQIVFNYII